jgi:hypothetical protein
MWWLGKERNCCTVSHVLRGAAFSEPHRATLAKLPRQYDLMVHQTVDVKEFRELFD